MIAMRSKPQENAAQNGDQSSTQLTVRVALLVESFTLVLERTQTAVARLG